MLSVHTRHEYQKSWYLTCLDLGPSKVASPDRTPVPWLAAKAGEVGDGHELTRRPAPATNELVRSNTLLRPVEEPENLTHRQQHKLAWVAKTNPRLHRAYLLKEGLRTVFVLKGEADKEALDRWINWARR
ncbi:MAG: hypothetical protein QOI95_35 [Acidimicrobiaceae bacterium]|jgi:hypothetical protein